MARQPTAIIDIGSNSIRLVVYSSATRGPDPIFNEKVLAGLGAGLAQSGEIGRDSGERALQALRRFKLLLDHLGCGRPIVLATAAVRDARNGRDFVDQVRRLGLPCRVVAAEEEATLAGLGVLSGIPEADGVAADLGGGSVELVELADGRASSPLSVPVGVLRLAGPDKPKERLRRAIRQGGYSNRAEGRCLYMVGGSWRALAKLDMLATDYPLPILQQYRIDVRRIGEIRRLAESDDPRLDKIVGAARLASAPAAAAMLQTIVDELRPAELAISSFGIREGALYSKLSAAQRRLDPLIESARRLSAAETGLAGHGGALDSWLSAAFDDQPNLRRLRLAACLIMDAARHTVGPFKAERAIELALHGNFVAIDAPGRVMVAQALAVALGGQALGDAGLCRLVEPSELKHAANWGLAMRAGERLSAGVPSILRSTGLSASATSIQLRIGSADLALVDEPVRRRLHKLARSLGLESEFVSR